MIQSTGRSFRFIDFNGGITHGSNFVKVNPDEFYLRVQCHGQYSGDVFSGSSEDDDVNRDDGMDSFEDVDFVVTSFMGTVSMMSTPTGLTSSMQGHFHQFWDSSSGSSFR